MINKYKIRCKNCGDILETKIPLKGKILCSCGNIGIYSDYIMFGMKNHKTKDECYEKLEPDLIVEEVEKYLNEMEREKKE